MERPHVGNSFGVLRVKFDFDENMWDDEVMWDIRYLLMGSKLDKLPGFPTELRSVQDKLYISRDGVSELKRRVGGERGLVAFGFESPEMLHTGFSSNLVLHSPGLAKIGMGKTLAENDAGVGGFGASRYDFTDDGYSTLLNPSPKNLASWPKSVAERWKRIHSPKSRNELALISWNTNGRLELRGCRESLIRSWARKGYVDIALIQETLKKSGSSLFDMFGPDWWNISTWAVSNLGRGSGGCTIYGQPSLFSKDSFMKKGGRICGSFIGDGLVLDVYFLTKLEVNPWQVIRKSFPFLLMN